MVRSTVYLFYTIIFHFTSLFTE